jgi:hypothetical protein
MSHVTHKPRDLLQYIHPDNCKPGRMLVQATPQVYDKPQGDWRRVTLKGHAPMLLSIAAWAIGPKKQSYTSEYILEIAARILITMPINIVYLLFPNWIGRQDSVPPMFLSLAVHGTIQNTRETTLMRVQ